MIGTPRRAIAIPIIVGLIAAYLLPLLWMVLTAFKSDLQSRAEPNAVFFAPTLDTLADIIGVGWGAILTSVQIATSVTVLVIVLAVPMAYSVSVQVIRVWAVISAGVIGALLVLQMVPQPMAVIPLYGILAEWRLVNSIVGVILADVALFTPFAVLLLRPFALAVPASLYEAASLDGASRFRAFRSVALPLMGNGIATIAAMVFILAWGEFIYATTLITNQNSLPVSGLLAQQTSLYSVSWNRLMGLALITSLPLLVVFLIAKRRLVEGLSAGAIK
ncbi:carbohydrate ABC transporter permease [Microbacterium aurantiacum]|uniref:carbohydrate ABC transporter permease n=1 Tax=Microbacterium aurantiacum TaxID=162393 RepID=UPI004035292E